jgi:hypothetical protein
MLLCDLFTSTVRLPPPTSVTLEFSNVEDDAIIYFSHTPSRFPPVLLLDKYIPK